MSQPSFRSLLDVLPVAVLAVGNDGTIAFANRQAIALFGYGGADELLGRPVQALLPEDASTVDPGHVPHRAGPTTTVASAVVGRRQDGTRFSAEVHAALVDDDGGDGALVAAVVRDISERGAIVSGGPGPEELGRIVGDFAHDFNNLVGVMLNYAALLADEVAGDPAAAADVAEIRTAAQRAAQLTNDLARLARPEVD